MHQKLWPGTEVPTLLEPTAKKGASGSSAVFVSSTIPTSLLMSSLCAHIAQHRSSQKYRYAASVFLNNLLKTVVLSGQWKIILTVDGEETPFPITQSGTFPSTVLAAAVADDAAVFRKLKKAWNHDAQDRCPLFEDVYHRFQGRQWILNVIFPTFDHGRTQRNLGWLEDGVTSLMWVLGWYFAWTWASAATTSWS